ncbi:hypothetical protein NEOLI_005273 [Neolecta irregularis DAH-3]|uniref:Uncharacterized protein n=1 Tax=Neolecta irregularis (strain DAH-3) TaxID=1198029 RepID=A0A1U7LHD4_NEOID|nr:hypothetical protein NEOLI_005273 [Neolecta irregularis DAH-3]|eukprot:OLL22038.1 hypothetical protein NEOLI_005273 [Neolecta irregularis DAH-3]
MKFSVLLVFFPFVESGHTFYQLWLDDTFGTLSRLSLMKNTNYHDAFWLADQGITQDIFYFEGNGLVKFKEGQYKNKMWAHVNMETDTNIYFLFSNPQQMDLNTIPADFKTISIPDKGQYLSVNGQTHFMNCDIYMYISSNPKECFFGMIKVIEN